MIVHIEGRTITIKEPRPATLKKYGLTLDDWKVILTEQGYKCPICTRVMEKTICVDHHHVQGYKGMKPENKKKHVRGLTCWWCNKTFLGRGITIERARNVVKYLERYEKRIHGD